MIPLINGDEKEMKNGDFISKIEDVRTLSGWSDDYKIVVTLKLKETAISFPKSDEVWQSAVS